MAGVQNSAALLLVDSVGDKAGSLFTAFRKKKDQNVFRGSLLVSIPPKDAPNTADGKPAYNYRVVGDDIMMYCSEYDVAPLTDYEFNLVSGIKSIGARYEAFVNDIMDWGSTVKVNDIVYVSLPSQQAIERTKRCLAVVRWIGLLPGEEGTKFGVELFEAQYRGAGNTNGFWRNQQLFLCDDNCGLFVSLDKLAKRADFPAIKNEPSSKTQSSVGDNLGNLGSRLGLGKSSETHSQGSSSNPGSRQGPAASTRSHTQKTNTPQFKVGDRVISYTKHQIPIHGTVKWTGGQTPTDSEKMNVVGIETDVSVQKEDFPIAVTGLLANFKCDNPRHGKVVLPESLIQLEKEVMEEKIRKRQEAVSKEHENSHRFIKQDEQKMLRDARIESQALDPEEQERLLREYNQQRDKQLKDKKLGSTKNESSSHNVPNSSFPQQPFSQELSKNTAAGRGKGHIFDEIAPIPHSSSAGDPLQQQSQSNNPASSQEEAMLREAKIETRALDKDEQKRLLQQYKKKQDEQRKTEAAGSRNALGSNTSQLRDESCVDPPDKYQRSSSNTYQNLPEANNLQPPDRAYAPPHSNMDLQFAMNARVQFSDPPRYGVIRWMGELPQVAGLIAGVELEENMEGCTNGTWKGLRYFSCNYGRGFFSPVSSLEPDQRNCQRPSNTPPLLRQSSTQPRGPDAAALIHGVEPGLGSTMLPATNREPIQGSASPSHHHQFQMNSRVQFSDPPRYGVIRWIGNLPQVAGLIAGVELEEYMEGCTDGTWKGLRYFSCKHGRGFFSPVSNLEPDQREVVSSPKANNSPPLPSAQPHDPAVPTQIFREPVQPPTVIAMGSAVEVGDPQDPHYGTLRWMGILPGHEELVAGIEMDEDTQRCGDGNLDGVQYFKCRYGRAYFCPLIQVRPDQRLADSASSRGLTTGNPLQVPLEESTDQQVPPSTLYVGDRRGIQGHQKSCYLDTTLFGLFALSDVFDEMFLEVTTSLTIDQIRKVISEMLWKEIVNPLRKNGVVRYESVMMMRNKLDELGKMEGIAEKEKDPEEFLNMLFKHMLRVPHFLLIRRPFGVEHEFFVPLFVEPDPNVNVPTLGELLKRMSKEQQMSLKKVPSKLLVQVPRFVREFKTYNGIIPDQKLEIWELTDTARVPECMFCGEPSSQKCSDCSAELPSAVDGFVYSCSTCALRTHTKKSRKDHKLQDAIDTDKLELYKLDLLSVICIETSHYVCFTRDSNTDTWIFFDSMANRVYDTYNIPKVTDCTRELNEWVYSGDRTRLMSTQPRQLPELVRRFTRDIYMCVYIQPDVAMYGDGEEEESGDEGEQGGKALVKQQDPTGRNTSHEIDQLKHEVDSLAIEKKDLEQRNEELVRYTEQAARQKLELQQQIDSQQRENQKSVQQLAEKEQQIQQLTNQKQQLETEKVQLQQGNRDLQRRLASAPESSVSRFTKVQIPSQDQDSWNVRRRKVLIQDELGHGAWGSVHKGTFRGKQVAVKKAHQQILHENTIEQLKREIRIMAHIQHPNLVRLIAAVVDDGVERQAESPLLILELLHTDLRSAYKMKVVDLKRYILLPIFRDVAYALHYLHEHQEPIIHRDVSAPNVLLQQTHPGVWKAKLSDFGSANLAKHCKTSAAGAIVYSAPETFPPRNPYDPIPKQTAKLDVFSYGYLLAESVAKEMPSPEKRAAMLSKIKQEWAPMHDIITACTEYEPERRLTMTQVLEKLHTLPSL